MHLSLASNDLFVRKCRRMDIDTLKKLLAALHGRGVHYVLVGGIALNVHGIIRTTEDVDFFVEPTPVNVARLRDALRDLWSDPEIDTILAEDLADEYPVVRYGPPDGSFTIDIMSGLGTAYSFADIESQDADLEGIPVRVATPRMLYRMKSGTVRPIDQADAGNLRRKFRIPDDADR